MRRKILPGHEYLVDLDRFTVRVRVLRQTSWGWECETIPIGTRVIVSDDVFRGDFAPKDASESSRAQ